jgi:serine/threonine-protein kinase HipA
MMNTCLYCYQPLGQVEQDYHPSCSKKMFGLPAPPILPYAESDLEPLARKIIQSQTTLTGVQQKLSLHISTGSKEEQGKRFTIVGLWGGYILKPPSNTYPELPESEDLTMHLAQQVKIATAPHCLIRLQSGNLAYLTRRMDRIKKHKLAMEDMCQLTQRLTEFKYNGSYEQIGKAITRYSANPGLDLIQFMEVVLFSFLTGNADMHLKNFSLLEKPGQGMVLSPAYDLLNTALVNPDDKEDLALTLNGKKKKINIKDFIAAMQTLQLSDKQQRNIFNKMRHSLPTWTQWVDNSFLNENSKIRYKEILEERFRRLFQT